MANIRVCSTDKALSSHGGLVLLETLFETSKTSQIVSNCLPTLVSGTGRSAQKLKNLVMAFGAGIHCIDDIKSHFLTIRASRSLRWHLIHTQIIRRFPQVFSTHPSKAAQPSPQSPGLCPAFQVSSQTNFHHHRSRLHSERAIWQKN